MTKVRSKSGKVHLANERDIEPWRKAYWFYTLCQWSYGIEAEQVDDDAEVTCKVCLKVMEGKR